MPGSLTGKTAVVTGASQGIGEAVARRFAEAGARLVLSELAGDSAGELRAVAAEIAARHPGSHAVCTITDVTDPDACDALIGLTIEQHGGLDVLAHATAVGQKPGPTVELAPEEWDRIMAVNAKGAFLLCRSASPHLTRPGAIIFTGSYTGLVGQLDRAAYCASKGALRLFTRAWPSSSPKTASELTALLRPSLNPSWDDEGLRRSRPGNGSPLKRHKPAATRESRCTGKLTHPKSPRPSSTSPVRHPAM